VGESVSRMDETIKEILDYSRNARLGIRPELINFKEIVINAFNDVKYYSDHNVDLMLDIENNLQFSSDKARLNTVVKNIIANAVKYSRREIANSYIRVKAHKKHDEIVLRIEDNGEGISETNIQKVFNMFFRASVATAGTGLGLYICKEIVSKLNGRIEVSSVLGKGSIFTIYFPSKFEMDTSNNE
jgi:signal transduction histidine kinase